MKRFLLAALLLLLPVGALADAPETATISGQIVDPGGSPLPGVSVTLSGERGDKFGITDENGNYRFVGVTPGDYSLTASLEGLGEAAAQATIAETSRAFAASFAQTMAVSGAVSGVAAAALLAGHLAQARRRSRV